LTIEPRSRLDRTGYVLAVEDRFEADVLDPDLWLPYYLPQWSSREAAAARYSVGGGELRLRIDADQPPWCPEWDGELRVSSLQTGVQSGPLGSAVGQHRFRPALVGRQEQPRRMLYTPRYGLFELWARAVADVDAMVALWMVGVEDRPEQSGEICVAEIFGRDVAPMEARVGVGVKALTDPSLRDEFEQVAVALDLTEPHWYAAEWTPDVVAFYVDEQLVKTVDQAIDYPMQLMLDIYDFRSADAPPDARDRYPKEFVVHRFRGWERAPSEAEAPLNR